MVLCLTGPIEQAINFEWLNNICLRFSPCSIFIFFSFFYYEIVDKKELLVLVSCNLNLFSILMFNWCLQNIFFVFISCHIYFQVHLIVWFESSSHTTHQNKKKKAKWVSAITNYWRIIKLRYWIMILWLFKFE